MVARTSRDDLVALLRALDVRKGEAVMAHSSVFTLGLIENGLPTLLDAFRMAIGDSGTLIVPTFTYSFRRNETYDVRNSPADPAIGVFSEFVRKHPDAIRSECPLFSMAAIGGDAASLMKRDSPACFGEGSIYGRLFEREVKTVSLGVPYSRGLSAFMHLEKLAGVPYREDLPLRGIVIDTTGARREDIAIHYSRVATSDSQGLTDREAMGAILEAEGAVKLATLNGAIHKMLYAGPWQRIVLRELAKDPCCMLLGGQ